MYYQHNVSEIISRSTEKFLSIIFPDAPINKLERTGARGEPIALPSLVLWFVVISFGKLLNVTVEANPGVIDFKWWTRHLKSITPGFASTKELTNKNQFPSSLVTTTV